MKDQNLKNAVIEMVGIENVIFGKGGAWIKKGGKAVHHSTAQLRKMTGVKAEPRADRMVVSAYGDMAWIAAINRVKS